MGSWGGGVGCHFSPSGSNTKNKNKSPMLIPIFLFPEVIIKNALWWFYFVHCIQFSQLNDYTSSEVALKSEVRAHHASAYLYIDTRPSPLMTRKPSKLSPSEMTTDPKLKTWCAGGGGGCDAFRSRSGTSVNASQARNRNGSDACIVLCIMYMPIQPTWLPINWFVSLLIICNICLYLVPSNIPSINVFFLYLAVSPNWLTDFSYCRSLFLLYRILV